MFVCVNVCVCVHVCACVCVRVCVCLCDYLACTLQALDQDLGILLDWPEPYIYAVYDHKFGDFPAKHTVYTPYLFSPGQP